MSLLIPDMYGLVKGLGIVKAALLHDIVYKDAYYCR